MEINIKEKEYKEIGNNLYYTDELIQYKEKNKDDVLHCYQIISEYFKENFSVDIYINNLNYLGEEIYFYGEQMVNKVLIDNTSFRITIQNNEITDFIWLKGNNFISEMTVDTNDILNAENIKKTAYNLAKQNQRIMLKFSDSNVINGQIYLRYNQTNQLYYETILINGSYIKINAKTGIIIDKFFHDGIIE